MKNLEKEIFKVAIVVAISFFMVVLDTTIINTSLPMIAKTLNVDPLSLDGAVSLYFLSLAVFIPLSSWVSSNFGTRNVFLYSIVIFAFASMLCALSTNLEMFILGRILQGVGGAFIIPVGRAYLLNNTGKKELISVISIITWPSLTAPIVGPVIGGVITEYLSWKINFLINLPICAFTLLYVLKYMSNSKPQHKVKMDMRGWFLCTLSLGLVYLCFYSVGSNFISEHISFFWAVASVFSFYLAFHHLNSCAQPLINLHCFTVKTFRLTTVTSGALVRCGINSTPFIIPLYFQLGLGYSPAQTGLFELVYFLGNMLMKPYTTQLLNRFGYINTLVVNGFLCGVSIAGFALIGSGTPLPIIVGALFFAGLTRSMQFTSINTLAFVDVSDGMKTDASTMSSYMQQVTGMLSIFLVITCLSVSEQLSPSSGHGFPSAFIVIGSLVTFASFYFFTLPRDSGNQTLILKQAQ